MTKQEIEEMQRSFEAAHSELKEKLIAAQTEKDFKRVLALLNEERAMVKENTEKMLTVMAASK